ncbi:hypothetical protein ACLM45_12975 [Synechococcus sp. A10-1-5-9]|uniref:hypothetical protein n=1 Tax=Synechococcus sp. A10-1-5-9 TaxID=3392295 RepID=UPI0039E8590C
MQPTDAELAVMFRWTLHTRWGVGGFMGSEGDPDFTCRCDSCTTSRRKRWAKESDTIDGA